MTLPDDQDRLKDWVEKVLEPVLRGDKPLIDENMCLGGLALLSADTDKVKEYVFESAKLPEIRGASMILDDLNQGWPRTAYQPHDPPHNTREVFIRAGLPTCRNPQEKEKQRLDCIVYAGGGSLLALVPGDLAEGLKREIEALYPRETDVATITCVWQPVSSSELTGGMKGYSHESLSALRKRLTPSEWQRIINYYHKPDDGGGAVSPEQFEQRKNFGELVSLQGVRLRRDKESKSIAPFIEAVPYARRCEACGTRPAARHVEYPEPRYLCSACSRKFGPDERRERKTLWNIQFEKYLKQDPVMSGRYLAEVSPEDVKGSLDLSEIGDAASGKARGYIGFIYADGNNIGRQVEESSSLTDYREKSDALSAELPKAVYQALGNHLRVRRIVRRRRKDGKPDNVNIHPFEVITIGGDDLLLIVPGDQALPIALDICRAFQTSKTLKGLFTSPTLSAGLVIADGHTPIYFLLDLAEQLLKSAKKRARELGSDEGTVDFLVLKSQTTLATSLPHLRSTPPLLFTNHKQKEKLYLTGRPYTLNELDKLMASAHCLKGARFPGSQLQGYRQALWQGRLRSTIYFLYQYARANQQSGEGKALLGVFREWQMMNKTNPSPWLKLDLKRPKDYTGYWTLWADIIEVMDFIPEHGSSEEGGGSVESGN